MFFFSIYAATKFFFISIKYKLNACNVSAVRVEFWFQTQIIASIERLSSERTSFRLKHFNGGDNEWYAKLAANDLRFTTSANLYTRIVFFFFLLICVKWVKVTSYVLYLIYLTPWLPIYFLIGFDDSVYFQLFELQLRRWITPWELCFWDYDLLAGRSLAVELLCAATKLDNNLNSMKTHFSQHITWKHACLFL